VLTAGASARRWYRWDALQQELSRLSSDGVHRVVPGANHGSIVADSTHAAAIVVAIHDVVDAVREHRTLQSLAAERGR
jgi:hypothetical protein